ncbi:threonine/serine exporter family protein [Uliginosibacterium sp. 31-16]|uniref:threonine/serine ThrE exporter family protein n=1 Tax=Uliginosibacterium sp. 31-16 TaxID=3068315 RepID=UPI00273F1D5F|nr:threonine/serine exporter family protein [Uliginosibacterium sp. 31-16]MDP5239888.1 threonine/serine exporter family protein [Uliginosibacterium sp. 31-16]
MSDTYISSSPEAASKLSHESDELRFIQRVARLLLQYNMRTSSLRERLEEIGQALWLPLQVQVGYRTVTVYTPDGLHVHAQAPEFRINIAVSAEVNRTIDKVCAGKMLLPEAIKLLDEVEQTAGRHSRWTLSLMFGLAAGALAWLLAADWAGMAVIALSSALGMLARQEMHRYHPVLFAMPFVAALIGSLLGGIVILLGWTQTPGICLIVPALMLVPGPHLINGLYDMLENNMQTGIPRLGLSAGILVAAAMGIFLGGWLTLGMTTVPPSTVAAQPIPLWLDIVLAGVASCGFGAFYNAPWRVLWTSIACGMVGHGIRYLCLANGMQLEIATLFACVAIGFMAIRWVSSMRIPFAAVAFAGAVPMMPGVLMFRSIGGAMDIAFAGPSASLTLVAGTLANMFKAAFVVGSMGMGLLAGAWIGSQVFRLLIKVRT